MASVKKNFTYSSILTLSGYIFPLLTYPYVSRVLGVSNIGICNFVESIIHYFIMFSTLGLSVTGIREIASVGADRQKRSQIFTSLLTLHAVTTIVAAMVLFFCIQVVPEFQENSKMMYIGLMKLIFNLTLIEWFYKGIEDFKYITNRTLIVRMIYVASVFVFVRDVEDYDIYYFLTNMSIVINSLINIVHARKFVSLDFSHIVIKPLLSGFLIIGVYNIVSSLYTTFNVAYLGMVTDTIQVGYYSTAQKLYTIIIALYTAFTGVMMPRMSSLISEGKIEEFKRYINKSTSVLFSFSIPLIVLTFVFSAEIIRILSGEGYGGAVIPMQIVMPLILIIGYEQILVIQTLMPMKKDKIVFRNASIGAVVGLTLNYLLVASYGAIGSAIVWLCCELVVLISAQFYVTRHLAINFPLRKLLFNLVCYVPAFAVCMYIKGCMEGAFIKICIASIFIAMYFVAIQNVALKDNVVLSLQKKILALVYKHK